MPEASPKWFRTETTLLDELRRLHPPGGAAPEIAGYEEIAELQRGGQGIVYSAVQKSTRRKVAIKVLLDTHGGLSSRRRFEREIDLVASLRHPRIVSVYDSGALADGRPFLVMEFVEGQTLEEYLQAKSWAGRPAIRAVVDLLARIAEAIEFAHQRGVIHRDLKPTNIRVDPTGEPRILDFGLAKPAIGDAADPTVSIAGQFVGSLAWASPEQAAGSTDALNVRSDVYSLGVMLYKALTGAFPYRVTGPLREVLNEITTTPATRPSRHAEWLDDEIETITLKCLAKDPARRYQSAGELARDLRRYLAGEPLLAKADSTWYTLRSTVRRHRIPFVAASLVALGLIVGSIVLSALYTKARDAADEKTATAAFLQEMLASANPTADGRDVRVVDVVDRAAKRLTHDAGLSPAVVASLRATLADTYAALGKQDQAIEQLVQVVEWRESNLGPDHLDTLVARRQLGVLKAQTGKLDDGEGMLRDVAARAGRLSTEDRAKLNVHQTLGEILFFKGKLPESETELRLALADQQAAPLAAPDRLPQVVASLGIVLRNQSRADEAVVLLQQALDAARPHFPRRSGVLVKITNSLGSALHDQQHFDQAERHYREALDMAMDAFGEDNEDTIAVKSNLAQLYADMGHHDRAEQPLREVVAASRRTYGNEHPSTLLVLNNYAKLLQNLGRLDEAHPLMQECVDGRITVLGPEHPHTLIAQSNLASMIDAAGSPQEALALERQVLAVKERVMGEGNFATLVSLNNVGMMLSRQGDPAGGLEYIERASRKADEVLKPSHWYACLLRGNIGRCCIKLGRFADAQQPLRSSYEGLKAAFGDSDKRTQQARASLAEALRGLERNEEAAALEPAASSSN